MIMGKNKHATEQQPETTATPEPIEATTMVEKGDTDEAPAALAPIYELIARLDQRIAKLEADALSAPVRELHATPAQPFPQQTAVAPVGLGTLRQCAAGKHGMQPGETYCQHCWRETHPAKTRVAAAPTPEAPPDPAAA